MLFIHNICIAALLLVIISIDGSLGRIARSMDVLADIARRQNENT